MTKKNQPAPQVAKEHGGACPTCGHCKCCEKKAAAPAPIVYPICTRPHYPLLDWTYRPAPVWYGTSTTEPNLTITADNTSSAPRFAQ